MKVAWMITGAEYFLINCIDIINRLGPAKVDVFISRAAKEIMERYNFMEKLKDFKIVEDRSSSSPEIFSLFASKYGLLVVAPATSNTVAKFVMGISDNLITNMFAQAGKLRMPTFVLPTDVKDEIIFTTKSGKKYKIWRRKVDKENIQRLSEMEGVKLFLSPEELEEEVTIHLEKDT